MSFRLRILGLSYRCLKKDCNLKNIIFLNFRFSRLSEVISVFENWKMENLSISKIENTKDKFFLPNELYFDLVLTCASLHYLAQKCVRFGIPFVPAYMNQNCVETWFSLQRARGGLNNSPTVANIEIISPHPLHIFI